MMKGLKEIEAALFLRLQRRPPTGTVERASFWLLMLLIVLLVLRLFPGGAGRLGSTTAGFVSAALLCFSVVLGFQWITGQVLWTVRNRLIATYLLMGLAPVVLFGTLAGIAAYVFSGQFAIDTTRAELDQMLARIGTSDSNAATELLHEAELHTVEGRLELPMISLAREPIPRTAVAAWVGRKRLTLYVPSNADALEVSKIPDAAPPPWLRDNYSGYSGVVAIGGKLFLCSTSHASDEHIALVTAAFTPLDEAMLSGLAQGLGSISVLPTEIAEKDRDSSSGTAAARNNSSDQVGFLRVQGGAVAAPAYFFDPRVLFSGRLHVIDWQNGQNIPAMLGVASRATLLYSRLFATSIQIGALVREILIAIAIVFALLEFLAFWMAVRLSRTITRSVADLYGATLQIDQGNLSHRIRVERRDQLAALATSFNVMASSLEHLLEQQREKERIQGELAIAQEVQNNLFPHVPILLPRFELYGICKPARSVSGDYYDFIHAGDEVCLALGDISGKGISAALLMASLHSAVRAYRLTGGRSQANGEGTASPSQLLMLLNRHLYSTTQPEKYATLFLGCYSSAEQTFTYANGGQLPPFLLRASGVVERLTCGGSVVGLLENLSYQEASVRLEPGDLFIAYSDGVTEPENEFGEFGEERLLALVRRHQHQPLAAISAEAMRALRNWIGSGEQPDDITLVLARQL